MCVVLESICSSKQKETLPNRKNCDVQWYVTLEIVPRKLHETNPILLQIQQEQTIKIKEQPTDPVRSNVSLCDAKG
jgi:hypothetical protein